MTASGSPLGRSSAPTGATRLAAVIGWPVRHSLSPVIQNAAFAAMDLDWVYVALEVAPGSSGAALDAMRSLGIAGLNVTMPHKADVAAAVDATAGDAGRLGAVNCVVVDGTRLIGHNTDGIGFVDALRIDRGVDVSGMRCLVVGAGGAARAVIAALAHAGAEVAVANRTTSRAVQAAALAGDRGRVALAGDLGAADLIVNATPVGMGTSSGPGGLPVDVDRLHPGQLVAELVYHPAVTPLMAAAQARGVAVVGGLGMLVHQAAHSIRLWTGSEPPIDVMAAAALAHLGRH